MQPLPESSPKLSLLTSFLQEAEQGTARSQGRGEEHISH